MSAGVFVVGLGVTAQGRDLGTPTGHLYLDAIRRALDDAGLTKADVDGVSARWPGPGGTSLHAGSVDWATLLGIPVRWIGDTYPQGAPGLMDAAAAVRAGSCEVALVVSGQGELRASAGLAPYTRPDNEFVAPFGAFTAAHFALVAQRYLHELGRAAGEQARQDVAELAATIRTMGSRNPEAVLTGKGVITADDVIASRMIASPCHLLDVCLANEGAVAMVVASAAVAQHCPAPVEILGVGCVWTRQQYTTAARFDDSWWVGADAAARAFRMAGLGPEDVDARAFYDATSFEVARQFEALGYCGFGEGPAFAVDRGIGVDGGVPTNTDGGLLAHSHTGWGGPHLRASHAVRQVRGDAGTGQVPGARTALACGAGSGAQYHSTIVFGVP